MRAWNSSAMRVSDRSVSLLLTGAGPRLAIAAVIILFLWAGFFWATGLPLTWLGGE